MWKGCGYYIHIRPQLFTIFVFLNHRNIMTTTRSRQDEIKEKHIVTTTLMANDYRKLLTSCIVNPEFQCSINDKEWDEDEAFVKVDITFRNCTKPQFHQRLIHFIIKTFNK